MTAISKRGVPVFFILLAVAVYIYSGTFPSGEGGDPGPQVFPRMIAVAIGILGLLKLVVNSKSLNTELPTQESVTREKVWWQASTMKRCLVFFSLIVGFILAFEWLGAYSATAIFLFSSFYLLNRNPKQRLIRSLVGSATFTIAVYLVFEQVFSIPLSPGIFI